MPNDNKFNQSVYAKSYNKSHYTERKIRVKPEIWAQIDNYCKENNISKNSFFINSALYAMDKKLTFDDISQKTNDSDLE